MLKENQDDLRQFGQKQFEMRKAKHMTQMQLADAMSFQRTISTGQSLTPTMAHRQLFQLRQQKWKLQKQKMRLLRSRQKRRLWKKNPLAQLVL